MLARKAFKGTSMEKTKGSGMLNVASLISNKGLNESLIVVV
jgi:hypothetical protein